MSQRKARGEESNPDCCTELMATPCPELGLCAGGLTSQLSLTPHLKGLARCRVLGFCGLQRPSSSVRGLRIPPRWHRAYHFTS